MKRNCSVYWFGLRWKVSQEWALRQFHHDFNRGWKAKEGKTKQHQHSLNSKKAQDLSPLKILCKLQIILLFEETLMSLFHCFSSLLSLVTFKSEKTIEVEQNRTCIYIFLKAKQNIDIKKQLFKCPFDFGPNWDTQKFVAWYIDTFGNWKTWF